MKSKKRLTVKLISYFCCLVIMGTSLHVEAVTSIKPPKYVFLFIGDGMSEAQISGAEMYKAALKSDEIKPRPLSFTLFKRVALLDVYNQNSYIPDSASAGTALSSGVRTNRGVIGLAPDLQTKTTSLADLAKQNQMKVGIISSAPLNHATPASFYAHVNSRQNYYEIGCQMATSNIDYFGGGGLLLPTGEHNNQLHLEDVLKLNGYQVIKTKQAFESLTSTNQKTYVTTPYLRSDQSLPYEIDRQVHEPSLSQYVSQAIQVLDNDNGFFIVVESGKIDYAAHENDGATVLHEMLGLDKAVIEAVTFAVRHPDETLIIVTADHETGGLSLGHKETGSTLHFEYINAQKLSAKRFSEDFSRVLLNDPNIEFETVLDMIHACFGLVYTTEAHPLKLTEGERGRLEIAFEASKLGDDQIIKQIYGGNDPLSVTATQILNEKVGLGWTTYGHTAHPVSLYAFGVGEELFEGRYENIVMYDILVDLMKW